MAQSTLLGWCKRLIRPCQEVHFYKRPALRRGLLALALLLLFVPQGFAGDTGRLPNIIFILADDKEYEPSHLLEKEREITEKVLILTVSGRAPNHQKFRGIQGN
jgi:hypothetical protein